MRITKALLKEKIQLVEKRYQIPNNDASDCVKCHMHARWVLADLEEELGL